MRSGPPRSRCATSPPAGSTPTSTAPGSSKPPWDYLGGLLACTEAGATVVDARDRSLAVTDPDARRQVLAAATPELLDALRAGMAP